MDCMLLVARKTFGNSLNQCWRLPLAAVCTAKFALQSGPGMHLQSRCQPVARCKAGGSVLVKVMPPGHR